MAEESSALRTLRADDRRRPRIAVCHIATTPQLGSELSLHQPEPSDDLTHSACCDISSLMILQHQCLEVHSTLSHLVMTDRVLVLNERTIGIKRRPSLFITVKLRGSVDTCKNSTYQGAVKIISVATSECRFRNLGVDYKHCCPHDTLKQVKG